MCTEEYHIEQAKKAYGEPENCGHGKPHTHPKPKEEPKPQPKTKGASVPAKRESIAA